MHAVLGLALPLMMLAGQPAEAAAPSTETVPITRDFVPGPFGQVHVRIARPVIESGKPPLVLFHPTPYSSDYFLTFMRLMARDRLVIAIDTPGYGDSDRPRELQSIAGYARSAAAVLQHLDQREVDLLGYHTGALIAAELAAQHPRLVRRLALPGLPFFTGEARRQGYAENTQPDEVKADGSHLAAKWEFAGIARDAGLPLDRTQEHFADMMQCHPHCWEAYHGVFTYPAETRFTKISQPVLLITTDGSLQDETKAALPYFPRAKLTHITGITMGGFDLAPDKFAAAIRPFLDSADGNTPDPHKGDSK